jgi:hypothetical protein
MITHSTLSAAVLTLVFAAPLRCHHEARSLALHLSWTPTSDASDGSSSTLDAFLNQKLQLLPFTDSRSQADIGENDEQTMPRPVTTPDDIPGYLTQHLGQALQGAHVNVVPTGGTRTLQGTLNQFFVKEDNMYNGTVILTFTLNDAQGKQLWQGVATGHSKRFGHSFSADNYNDTLSEATMEAVRDLLKNPSFLAAVHSGKPG